MDYHLSRYVKINTTEGGGILKIREKKRSRTVGFDILKHVNCSWYQNCCQLSDIVIGEVMLVRRSHIPVLSKNHFRDDLFILRSPSIAAPDFGKYKQKK